jgi:hypothetical protein
MARFRVSFTGLIITVLCASMMDPSAAFALKDHTRDGWMVGFSMGAGPGKFKEASTGAESTSETGGVVGLRVGRNIHPLVVLGAEMHLWNRTEKTFGFGETAESDFTFLNLALTGTYYPAGPATPLGGLYLRGGIATSTVENEVTTGDISLSFSEDGWGLLLGGGYELRLKSKFALGAGVSFSRLSIGGDLFDSARYMGYGLVSTAV